MSKPAQFLIQDPYHEYGAQFIEHIHRKYGHRAVCIYTNHRERLVHEPQFTRTRCGAVAASYDVDLDRLGDLVDTLKLQHHIIAVIPFNETSVLPAVEVASSLGLEWAQPGIMPLFRNKFALKDHLRRNFPELRINASRLVQTTRDVLSVASQPGYRRFVIKPNDGFGNRDIAFFDQQSTAREIGAYLRRMKGSELVMEEYVDGTEYFVNGQIDERGNPCTVAIFEYSRRPANGRCNIDFETSRLSHGAPLFAELARYAERVMRSSGLRRCPFHLELKVDEGGPCLIEAAARLAGNGNARLSGELHGSQLDLIDVASHYYLRSDHRDLRLNWRAYDSQAVRYVHGIALRPERIYELEGIEEVEALPEFYSWVSKPVIGIKLQRTVDCLTMPWCLILKAPTERQVADAADRVRRLIRWNSHLGIVRRAAVGAKIRGPRLLKRIQRGMHSALPRFPRYRPHEARR